MRLLVPLAISLAIAGSGCNFAVKHPAATAGIVVGAIGLATCSLTTSFSTNNGESLIESPRMKCYGVTAIAGLAITGVASLALWLGYEDDVTPAPGGTSGPVHDPTNLEPAPVFVPKTPPVKPEPKPDPAPTPP